MKPLMHCEDTAPQAAARLGRDLIGKLTAAIDARGEALLVLSGGSTPLPLFEFLARQPIPWRQVRIMLADERCVPTTHRDSNARLVRRHLLRQRAAQARFLPLFEGDAVNGDAGRQADSRLRREGRWDAVVLGMGADGHVASLFPGTPELQTGLDPDAVEAALMTRPGNAPHARITQTLARLLNTRFLALHIAGAGKWRLLQQAIRGQERQWPVSAVVHQQHVPLHVYASCGETP